jgi:hypothetical protein
MPPRIGNNPTFASVRVQQSSGGQTEDDMEYKAWVRVGTYFRAILGQAADVIDPPVS